MFRTFLALLALLLLSNGSFAQTKGKSPFGFEAVKTDRGVEIANVTNQGLAYQMALMPGDRFVRVKGREIKTLDDLFQALGEPRGEITITVITKYDKEQTVKGRIRESFKEPTNLMFLPDLRKGR